MLNKIIIMGRITKDLELKRTSNGTAVTSFTIACDRDFKSNGEKETDFIDVVAWKGTAEFICSNFSKGRMIAIDGRLQTRTWQDKNSNNRKSVEVLADHVYFSDSRKSQNFDNLSERMNGFAEIQEEDEEENCLPF